MSVSEDPTKPSVSIVIPAFNEAERIDPTLAAVGEYAKGYGGKVELVLVDDGSADDTAKRGKAFASERLDVQVLINEVNRGKGYSVRRGMMAARCDVVLMSDADLSTPLEELEKLLPWVEEGYEVVIGSRAMKESVLDPPQPFFRRVMGHVFRVMRGMLMLSGIRDTQCGFKLFTREAAQRVFKLQESFGFAFDSEALGIAEALGFEIKEVGVVWRDDPNSTVHWFKDTLGMVRGLWYIRRRLKRLKKELVH